MKHKSQTSAFRWYRWFRYERYCRSPVEFGICHLRFGFGSNAASQRLASLGAKVMLGHAAENIAGADAVVTSTAVKGR